MKQSYVKPEDDWIRIEKNHEPLVSERDFEIVQRLLGMDTRTSPDQKQVYLLSGIAVCADCGAPMTRKGLNSVVERNMPIFMFHKKKTKRCSSHRNPEKDLETWYGNAETAYPEHPAFEKVWSYRDCTISGNPM